MHSKTWYSSVVNFYVKKWELRLREGWRVCYVYRIVGRLVYLPQLGDDGHRISLDVVQKNTMNGSAPADWDRLLSACQNNDSYLVFRLVFDEGVSPSHSNKFGQSALHIAALWVHGKTYIGQNFLENCHQHRTRRGHFWPRMKFVYTVLIKSWFVNLMLMLVKMILLPCSGLR